MILAPPDRNAPSGDHDWGISAEIDLSASDAAGEPVVRITGVDRL